MIQLIDRRVGSEEERNTQIASQIISSILAAERDNYLFILAVGEWKPARLGIPVACTVLNVCQV